MQPPLAPKKMLHNYYLFIRDFFRDLFDSKLGHYASSLSWSTLFSMIPLLVILLSIFTHLPLFDSVYEKVKSLIFSSLMPTDSQVVLSYIERFIESTTKLGLIGTLYVLIATVLFFKNYDYVVNDIFQAPIRSPWEALKTYTFLLLTIPTLLGSSFYLSSLLDPYLQAHQNTPLKHLYTLIPYLIVWMIFYVAYQFSANEKVRISSALTSSFIASLIWYVGKSGFIFYVLHNKTYTTIYGSIATLLFFFLWIYISWAIFIHGLKFCDLLNKEVEIEHI